MSSVEVLADGTDCRNLHRTAVPEATTAEMTLDDPEE